MITMATFAEYFENELNALIPSGENYEFKIWAEAGHYKMPYRQGNTVYYFINALLATSASAVAPNALVMGVNGLTLSVLVPTLPPKTNVDQTDEELDEIQDGQLYMIQQVGNILLRYFTKTKTLSMADDQGNNFSIAMYSGVAISGVIDIYPKAGQAMPMSVSITMNFAQGGVNGMAIKVYVDGTLVPYLTLNPSRSGQLATDVQSNSVVQKHLSTSSAFGLQFTCPSANSNSATGAIYDYIADGEEANTAHFVEVEWGASRHDEYLMVFTTANGTVSGAEFAGLNVTLGEAYQNEEFLSFPQGYGLGKFSSASSSAAALSFTVTIDFVREFGANNPVPDVAYTYYYIAGKAYRVEGTKISGTTTAGSFTATATVTASLSPENYAYDESTDSYMIYFVVNGEATVSDVTSGFTYTEI